MAEFSLGGLIAGAGQGMTDVGKSMTTVGASLGLEQQREAAQTLRDERLQAFTGKQRELTAAETAKEHGLDRSSKERQHAETLAASERATAASLLKNATDALKMAKVDYATDPSNPQYIKELETASKDYKDALSVAKSRLSTAAGGKAEAPKPAAGPGEKRDWKAFAPGAAAESKGKTEGEAKPGLINTAVTNVDTTKRDEERLAQIERELEKPETRFNLPLRQERASLLRKLGMHEAEE